MLSEQEVQRYSRQILLRSVGGRGQDRLLDTVVEWRAPAGPVTAVAAAYLQAGGTQVRFRSGPPPGRGAFPGNRAPRAECQSLLVVCAVGDEARPPAIVLGRRREDGLGSVVFAGPGACATCFAGGRAGLLAWEEDDENYGVPLGALIALTTQRIILGVQGEGDLGAVSLGRSGLFRWEVGRCPRCSSPLGSAAF
jgi:hypothetical protein